MENSIDTNIYSELMIQEMCDQYIDKLICGMNNQEAVDSIISEYVEYIIDIPNCGYRSWFALADTQWKYGLLTDLVKNNALKILKSKEDLELWKIYGQKVYNERKKLLEKLEQKLQKENQKPKKIVKKLPFKQDWEKWDVYALKIKSPIPECSNLMNEYLLMQKIDEMKYLNDRNVVPVIWAKITRGEKLPTSNKEYDELDYIQVGSRFYEDRILPLHGGRPFAEQIKEKLKLSFPVDEFGYLPEYRLRIVASNKKEIPDDLLYIGRFPNVIPPKNEYVHSEGIEIFVERWATLNQYLVKAYVLHNLRMRNIYDNDFKREVNTSDIMRILMDSEKY